MEPEPPVVSHRFNDYYENADAEEWQGIFESPGRVVYDRRFEVLKAIGIYPGMIVADVGAGTGLYSMLFARAVGSCGRVYAADVSESFVADIERRAAEYYVENVEAIVYDQKETNCPRTASIWSFSATPTTTSSTPARCSAPYPVR